MKNEKNQSDLPCRHHSQMCEQHCDSKQTVCIFFFFTHRHCTALHCKCSNYSHSLRPYIHKYSFIHFIIVFFSLRFSSRVWCSCWNIYFCIEPCSINTHCILLSQVNWYWFYHQLRYTANLHRAMDTSWKKRRIFLFSFVLFNFEIFKDTSHYEYSRYNYYWYTTHILTRIHSFIHSLIWTVQSTYSPTKITGVVMFFNKYNGSLQIVVPILMIIIPAADWASNINKTDIQ